MEFGRRKGKPLLKTTTKIPSAVITTKIRAERQINPINYYSTKGLIVYNINRNNPFSYGSKKQLSSHRNNKNSPISNNGNKKSISMNNNNNKTTSTEDQSHHQKQRQSEKKEKEKSQTAHESAGGSQIKSFKVILWVVMFHTHFVALFFLVLACYCLSSLLRFRLFSCFYHHCYCSYSRQPDREKQRQRER